MNITIPFRGSIQLLLLRLEQPLAARLAKGAFWSFFGSILSRVLALVSSILAARILGKPVYGEFGVVQSTIGMIGMLAGFGMGNTAAKFVAEFRVKEPKRAARIISMSRVVSWSVGSVLAIIFVIISPWMSRVVLGAPQLTLYLSIGAAVMLFSAINGAQMGVLSGLEAFKTAACLNSISGILNFLFIIGGAYFFGLLGIVLGTLISQVIICILTWLAMRLEIERHGISLYQKGWKNELPILVHFTVPSVLGSLMIGPTTWACTAMLVNRPHGFEKMAAFNAANQWFNALLWLPYVLAQALLPILSERVGANDDRRSTKLLFVSIKMNAVIVFPIVFGGCVLSPYIMSAYGKGFRQEWPTLIAVLASASIGALQIPIGNMIAATGKMWLGLGMNLVCCTVFLVCTWFLLPWGPLGLAAARCVGFTVQGIWAFSWAFFLIRKTLYTRIGA